MSKKKKLVAYIMAMCLIAGFAVISVLAATSTNMKIGGNITFSAEGVSFTVGEGKFYEDDSSTLYTGITSQSGKMQGFSMDTDTKIESVQDEIDTWLGLALEVDVRGDAILKFNVQNDMSSKELCVIFEISHGENTNDNMSIITQFLQTIPAGDDKNIEIKFDILDVNLNAGLDDFEISVTFIDKVEVNSSGLVENQFNPVFTNVKYDIINSTNKYVSAKKASNSIAGNVVIMDKVYIDNVPYTVTSIPTEAFYQCDQITSVFIPGTVETIQSCAFQECGLLQTVSFAEGIKTIGDAAFDCCYELSGRIIFPNSLESINEGAFGVSGGFIATFGENLKTIGTSAFENIKGEVILPNKLTTIGETAFAYTRITKVYIPKSVTSIGEFAFLGCYNVRTLTVDPANTKYKSENNCLIDVSAKKLLCGFKNAVIPTDASVTAIETWAFMGQNVKSVYIPASVNSIGLRAFATEYLEHIVVADGNAKYHSAGDCLIETASGTLVAGSNNSVIPTDGSIKTIATHAFHQINIKRIVIPASVTTMREDAIENCEQLEEIIVQATTPPAIEGDTSLGQFGNTNNCPIRVPAGSVNAYKSAPIWKIAAGRIVAI